MNLKPINRPADAGYVSEFVVVDFETANERRGSPCSVGYAVVEDMQITDSGAFLIRPPEFRFAGFNVSLHRITPEMCESASPWPDAFERLLAIVNDRMVVAHYAPFDIGVIRDACAATNTQCPELRFACTRQVARMVWPGLGSYSLPDVVRVSGAATFNHHDAESDALAAAHVALAATRETNASSFEEMLRTLRIVTGTLHDGMYTYAGGAYGGSHVSHHVPRSPSAGAVPDADHPFYGKKVVFTGGMVSMTRPMAQQAVVDMGGRAVTSVSKFTDYLVVGGEFHGLLNGHDKSSKLEAAIALRESGHQIEMLDEVDFLAVLLGGA